MWCAFYNCEIYDVDFIVDEPHCDMMCQMCGDCINDLEDVELLY